MQKSIFIFIFLILIFTHSFAQNKQEKKLIQSLDKLIPERLTDIAPGCVVLVVKKDKIIYKKAFGFANT